MVDTGKRRVVVIRHSDSPPDDRVHTALLAQGYEVDLRQPFAGDSLGDLSNDVAGTVLHGGPYNVYETEQHPFLNDEYRWLNACMKADLPVLGICQGAQQIAHHLGAFAGPRPEGIYEFGYYRVDPVPDAEDFMPGPLWFAQAHVHTFDIPDGAQRLAGSEAYENQAFRYGDKTFGLQFHPEVTIEGFRRWQAASWAPYDQPGAQDRAAQTRLMLAHDAAQADWFYGFMARLFPEQ